MKFTRAVFSVVFALSTLTGCTEQENNDASLQLNAAHQLNANLHRKVASTLDVSTSSKRAVAWITLSTDTEQGELFIQIDEQDPVQIEDTEAIPVLDPETPPQVAFGPDDVLYVSYSATNDLENKWNAMAIRFVYSNDGGDTWSQPISVGENASFGGYRNDHEMAIALDGTVYVAWLDSRFQKEEESGTIRVVISRSTDGGQSWSQEVVVDQGASCECCRVALAVDAEGNVLAGWRKILPGGIRDIVVARSEDQGATWSEPVRVFADDWEMAYCPDAGPAMQMGHDGTLHLAWWTGKEGEAGVKYTKSTDGGSTFTVPVELKTASLSKASHVQLAVNNEGHVAVAWDDGALETPRIALRSSKNNGDSFDALRHISSETKSAAYPVAAFDEGRLLLAYHTSGVDDHTTRKHDMHQPIWMDYVEDLGPQLVFKRIPM